MTQYRVRLRDRRQITLPKAAVNAAHLEPGDTLILETVEDGLPMFTLRPLLKSYAGTLPGMYGNTTEEISAYLKSEAASWDEQE